MTWTIETASKQVIKELTSVLQMYGKIHGIEMPEITSSHEGEEISHSFTFVGFVIGLSIGPTEELSCWCIEAEDKLTHTASAEGFLGGIHYTRFFRALLGYLLLANLAVERGD